MKLSAATLLMPFALVLAAPLLPLVALMWVARRMHSEDKASATAGSRVFDALAASYSQLTAFQPAPVAAR